MDLDCATDNRDKFEWDEFLESRGLEPAPNAFFHHVEKSHQNLLAENMTVEVCHTMGTQPKYWYAKITMKCGPFLRLLYEGYEDTEKEFWADPITVEIRPVGFAEQHGYCVEPPADLKLVLNNYEDVIASHKSRTGQDVWLLSPIQQVKVGMKVEVESFSEPRMVWVATVTSNVGGRLLLQYDNFDGKESDLRQIWLFCLSPRLHPIGWASKQIDWQCKAPGSATASFPDFSTLTSIPEEFFLHSDQLIEHGLEAGTVVSGILSSDPDCLKQGTVKEIIDEFRFVVEFETGEQLCCTLNDGLIFKQDVLNSPQNEGVDSEQWKPGLALEVVHQLKKNEIHAGVVSSVHDSLLRVLVKTSDSESYDFYVSSTSHDIFPVGWCDSHGVGLKGPSSFWRPRLISQSEHEDSLSVVEPSVSVSYWCPKIFFNFRCFSGPLLSKVKIAALPQSVGPGPIVLVLKEVLTLLVSGGYKPGFVLRQIQCTETVPAKGMHLEPLKAKYRQNTYRAMVPVASTAADVDHYCKWICEKLQCCPYLFGPEQVGDPCPKKCSVLAKVHGQVKKKQAAWRHRKFEDLVKHVTAEAVEVAEAQAAAEAAAAAAAAAARPPPVPSPPADPIIVPLSNPEPMDEGVETVDVTGRESVTQDMREEAREKRRRGRPRRCPVPGIQDKETPEKLEKPSQSVSPPQTVTAKKVAALEFPEFKTLNLKSNPRFWTANQVVEFLKHTECHSLANLMLAQNVDGVSFMLLNLSTILNFVTVDLEKAWKLCYLIGCVKMTYYNMYDTHS